MSRVAAFQIDRKMLHFTPKAGLPDKACTGGVETKLAGDPAQQKFITTAGL
jgi:hypothetical protein